MVRVGNVKRMSSRYALLVALLALAAVSDRLRCAGWYRFGGRPSRRIAIGSVD